MLDLEKIVHFKNWSAVPETLKSKTKWRQEGYKLKKDAIPSGKIYGKQNHQWIYLYPIEQCDPIKTMTEKQEAALKKARETLKLNRTCDICGEEETHSQWIVVHDDKKHCRHCHELYLMELREEEVSEIRKEIATKLENYLANGAVILDTETTGLASHDEIIELAIIDSDETVLLHSFYKPSIPISDGALAVHGYTEAFLADKPSIVEDYERLKAILTGRTVLIYNASFDDSILYNTLIKYGLETIEYNSVCMMHTMMEYFDSERFISLAEASGYETAHDALSDCYQVLRMIRDVINEKREG